MAEIPEIGMINQKLKSKVNWIRRRTIGSVTYEETINVINLNQTLLNRIKQHGICSNGLTSKILKRQRLPART
jgi:hypothetical protein